jgi:cell division protein FtsB
MEATPQRTALERQLHRAELIAKHCPEDRQLAEVRAILRGEIATLDQGGSAARAETLAALARQFLNTLDLEARLS